MAGAQGVVCLADGIQPNAPPPGPKVEVVVSRVVTDEGTPTVSSAALEVVAARVTLKKGDSIAKALDERHFEADAQAMALVYTWNPEWPGVVVEADSPGYLPVVRAAKPGGRPLPAGARVKVGFEPARKARIGKYGAAIDQSIQTIRAGRKAAFSSPAVRAAFLQRLLRLERLKKAIMIAIGGNAIPLHADYLRQVEGDLKVLDAFLSALPARVDDAVNGRLDPLTEALELRAHDLVEVRGPEQALNRVSTVAVSVSVLDADLKRLSGFRVRYVAEALWDVRASNYGEFLRLTPSATADLIQADYWIYTADDPKIGTARRAKVKVRKSPRSPLPVDLLLERK
jgi:hypothetical protein